MIVGGYALIAWGVPRQTADIDLLIPEDERSAWKDLLADLGYGIPQEQGGFVQYPAHTVSSSSARPMSERPVRSDCRATTSSPSG